MKQLKGYYAYLAISGGMVLNLAVQGNWAFRMLAFALVAAGALSLQHVSIWFQRASIAADVKMVFSLALGPAVIPPGLLRTALECADIVVLLLTGCMLLMAVKDQMHRAENSVLPEWAVLVLWSAGSIITLLILPGWLNFEAQNIAVSAANMLTSLSYVLLIVEMFRAQRVYLQTEEQE